MSMQNQVQTIARWGQSFNVVVSPPPDCGTRGWDDKCWRRLLQVVGVQYISSRFGWPAVVLRTGATSGLSIQRQHNSLRLVVNVADSRKLLFFLFIAWCAMAAYNSSTVQIMHVNFWSARPFLFYKWTAISGHLFLSLCLPNASKIGEDRGLKPSMEDDL